MGTGALLSLEAQELAKATQGVSGEDMNPGSLTLRPRARVPEGEAAGKDVASPVHAPARQQPRQGPEGGCAQPGPTRARPSARWEKGAKATSV